MRFLCFASLLLPFAGLAQEDPVLKFSRQMPRVEFLYVISDGAGDVFALGRTRDARFSVPGTAAQPRLATGYDAVVAKFRGSDGEMIAATYLGGSGEETPAAIAVDAQGFVYITGTTQARNFPTTEGAFQKTPGRSTLQGFVTKLNNNLTARVYSTYFGGDGPTRISALAVDRIGNVYLTGTTDARDIPTTPGAFRATGGAGMAFVAKMNSGGTGLVSSTYLGVGSPAGIAVDADGNPVVAGHTSAADFPVTPGAMQLKLNRPGSSDLFVSRLSATGALPYSTYLGGEGNDQATRMVMDASGGVYLAGITYSTAFPGTTDVLGEIGTGFVSKFAGTSVAWTRALRANGVTTVSHIQLDAAGEILASGSTASTHFPTTAGAYRRCVPPEAIGLAAPFYTRIGADGALKYSTYLNEISGGPAWAATLPGGDLFTISRFQTSFEQAPNLIRRYTLAAAPAIRLDCVLNAASYRTAGVTPGMAVTLFGSGMGPAEGVLASIDDTGRVATSGGGVRVLFNDVPAPLLFVRQDQINAVVPFGVANAATAQVRVEYEGRAINRLTLPVKTVEPGIFRLGSTEFGAILNEDNSLNTPENPVARGSVITFWAVGLGPFERSYEDGAVIGEDLSLHPARVRVSFLGVEAEVLYAGTSPGMVAGITQVNVRVPAGARVASRVPIAITIGDTTLQELAYLSIK